MYEGVLKKSACAPNKYTPRARGAQYAYAKLVQPTKSAKNIIQNFHKNLKNALLIEKKTKNILWVETIFVILHSLMKMSTF